MRVPTAFIAYSPKYRGLIVKYTGRGVSLDEQGEFDTEADAQGQIHLTKKHLEKYGWSVRVLSAGELDSNV